VPDVKVAVFSDVHGNLIALERFLEATASVADAYVCLGDVVNYGPWNDECLAAIHDLPNVTLLEGNHERLFLGTEDVAEEIPLVARFFEHSFPTFTRPDLISGLRRELDLGRFRCTHTIDGLSIYADTPITVDRDYLIGHTHHQFRIACGDHVIVNPGSVGQNRAEIDVIDYAFFDTEAESIELRSLTYDVAAFIKELRARRYPAECIAYYESKRRRGDPAT
jgi:predicted phosphodiesterase